MKVHLLHKVSIDGPSSSGSNPVLVSKQGEAASYLEERGEYRAAEEPLEHGDLEGSSSPIYMLSPSARETQFSQIVWEKVRRSHSGRFPIYVNKMSKSKVQGFKGGYKLCFDVEYAKHLLEGKQTCSGASTDFEDKAQGMAHQDLGWPEVCCWMQGFFP
ncbi:hypothetical protein ACP70R_033336 [Stipagrostis hirtigluma subsp. patula]